MMRYVLAVLMVLVSVAARAQDYSYTDYLAANVRVCIGCSSVFGSTSPLQIVGLPNLAGTVLTADGSGNLGLAATGTATVTNHLAVQGNTTLGNGTGDDVTITGRIAAGIGWKTDNTYDLGATGANRPRDLWLGRNAALGGDLAVEGGDITAGTTVRITPSGDLRLTPTGVVVLDPTSPYVQPLDNYETNLGLLNKKFLTIHAAELWVQLLVAQETLATIGGRILVAPTTTLTIDHSAALTAIYVKHNNLANGDRVYLESNGKVEFMAITSAATNCTISPFCGSGTVTTGYGYTVTRNLDASGANDWYAGDAVLNTGTTGDGFIDLYSVRGVKASTEYGPTIVGNVRLSATYNDWEPRWAVGNLNGLYGYSSDIYGAAFGDDDAENLVIDATNGIRFRSGTTVLGSWVGSIVTLGQPLTANNTGQIIIDSDELTVNWRNNVGATVQPFFVKSDATSSYVIVENWEFRGSTMESYADAPMTIASGGTFNDLTLRGGAGGAGDVVAQGSSFQPSSNNSVPLGTSSLAWSELYLAPATTTTDYNPLVLGASGQVLEKTDGVSATITAVTSCTSLVFHSGLLVSKAGC